jgi:hypothetical protein
MSLSLPSAPVPREVVPHCVACLAEPSPHVQMSMQRIGDGSMAMLCVHPSACKTRWSPEDRKGH